MVFSNELLIQWGKCFGQQQTNFPIAFKNQIFLLPVCPNCINNGYAYVTAETYIYDKTLTYFYRDCFSGNQSFSADYIAIGI